MATKALEQMKLSGKELAALILTRLNEILLDEFEYTLQITAEHFIGRDVIEPHYKLTFTDPEDPALARRIVWLPTVRETKNSNMFFVTFVLLNEDLDVTKYDSTAFSYSSTNVPHEWSTDDAAMHIYTYLSEQMLDGSKFE